MFVLYYCLLRSPRSNLTDPLFPTTATFSSADCLGFHSPEASSTDLNKDCNCIYAAVFTELEGMVAAPAPSSSRPAKGVAFKDPAFGTCVVRATNHNTEPPSGFARNAYSRRQAFTEIGRASCRGRVCQYV